METTNPPAIGLSKGIKYVFPAGAALCLSGVLLNAVLERHSFENTHDWEFAVFSRTFFPSLMVGSAFMILGAFLDRQRLPRHQSKRRGIFCLAVSAASFALLASLGNVHSWTFALMFPAFAGLIAGIIFLA